MTSYKLIIDPSRDSGRDNNIIITKNNDNYYVNDILLDKPIISDNFNFYIIYKNLDELSFRIENSDFILSIRIIKINRVYDLSINGKIILFNKNYININTYDVKFEVSKYERIKKISDNVFRIQDTNQIHKILKNYNTLQQIFNNYDESLYRTISELLSENIKLKKILLNNISDLPNELINKIIEY